ncbi:MAG: GNAT family N-acetyltransferase [Desulfovibrio sp.]|nr:GNAT family N-acetyltransferase [Desulfovibrio sp.]
MNDLGPYREIVPEDAELLLRWRCSPRVSQGYGFCPPNEIEAQKKWILDSRESPDSYHWLALDNGNPAGYTKFHHWDREKGTCRTGGYLGSPEFTKYVKFGADMFHSFLFHNLNIKEVHIRILESNTGAIRFNSVYGFRRNPEGDAEATRDNGVPTLAFVLDKDTWLKKFRIDRCLVPFPTEYWKHSPFK